MIVGTLHRRSGYTLIELILVVGILGLSAALLIPNLVNRDSLVTQMAVRRLIGDITFAQSDALAHQELRRVHFYADGRGYCIVRIDSPGETFDPNTADYVIDPISRSGDGLYIIDFTQDERFEGISIVQTDIDTEGGPDLYFDMLGGTITNSGDIGQGGDIVIGTDDESFLVSIAPFTGKLTVVQN
jgi:prepilin-type N-terminal cleavage/methylation domain-containing protein